MTGKTVRERHDTAMTKQRRIINLFDCIGNVAPFYMMDPNDLVDLVFHNIDAQGTYVDTIIWDIGYFYYENYAPVRKRWVEKGFDIVQMLIDGTKKRGIECMVNYRMNRVAWKPARLSYDKNPPYPWEESPYENVDLKRKRENPDWCLHTWWSDPLFNYESEGVRNYVIDEIVNLMNRYAFDGILLDFSRHVPVLPPGQQWALRALLTDMMRNIKHHLMEIEQEQARAVLLCAKVPSCELGCKIDGFDVKAWVDEALADLLVLGSRTMNVDVDFYRRLTKDTNICIYPCIDDHHATDGYRSPGLDWYRGLVCSWLQQGADGYTVFNFNAATPDIYEKYGMIVYGIDSEHKRVLQECGDPNKMRYEDKKYAWERRWGYPWSEGFFNQNAYAPLPAILTEPKIPFDGRDRLTGSMVLADRFCEDADRIKSIEFSLVFANQVCVDEISFLLNGITIPVTRVDEEHKDPQITQYHDKKPVSGGTGLQYKTDPNQRLTKAWYEIECNQVTTGRNFVEIIKAGARDDWVKIEKIECEVRYR